MKTFVFFVLLAQSAMAAEYSFEAPINCQVPDSSFMFFANPLEDVQSIKLYPNGDLEVVGEETQKSYEDVCTSQGQVVTCVWDLKKHRYVFEVSLNQIYAVSDYNTHQLKYYELEKASIRKQQLNTRYGYLDLVTNDQVECITYPRATDKRY